MSSEDLSENRLKLCCSHGLSYSVHILGTQPQLKEIQEQREKQDAVQEEVECEAKEVEQVDTHGFWI